MANPELYWLPRSDRWLQAAEILYGALHAVCARKPLLDAGVHGLSGCQRQRQYEHPRADKERGPHDVAVIAVAACPQRKQPAAAGCDVLA